MPAKVQSSPKTFFHVYNAGVEKRSIFGDAQDYEVFQGYLADYLTPPADPESVKKAFTINGRSFQGTPHQPKNHFGKIELVAYGLMPDHFHLLLREEADGHLESFIRSLCTRYSMYFNKKYDRRGSLFEGPYKSVGINEEFKLLPLVNFIHHGANNNSSYPEYSGKRDTSWVNINIVPFDQKVMSDKTESDLLDGITLEENTKPLERRDLADVDGKIKPTARVPEIFAISVVFLVLLGMGLRNIKISNSGNLAASSPNTSPVLSESTEATNPAEPAPASEPKTKTMVIVKTPEGSDFVNIRQSPTVDSEKIGTAKNGESFELVSEDSGWYQIRLPNDQTGFILSELGYLEQS
jgi:putative transposase